MRAVGTHREKFFTSPCQDHVFVIDAPDDHRAIRKPVERNAAFQVRF
jgi:hypothetical protein